MKLAIISGLLCVCFALTAQAQYTFGTQESSNPGNASITYTSGNFQYTDPTTPGDDNSMLLLTSGASITTTRDWNASLSVNLGSDTLTSTGNETPQFGLGLGINAEVGGHSYLDFIYLAQDNNTGSSTNSDVASYLYGTIVNFGADEDGNDITTTTLGAASNYNGDSYEQLSGSSSTVASTESVGAASGVLTLNFKASTDLLTGSYNGTSIGSINLGNLGTNPTLTLGVVGFSGEGVAVTSGLVTGTGFSVTPEPSTWALLLVGFGGLACLRRAKFFGC